MAVTADSSWRHPPWERLHSMRVLIVEDERRMADVIHRALAKDGMAADVATDGGEALELATIVDYDAIVLDVMLPGATGFDVCRELRRREVWAPVLMLTALEAVHDRVAGLDSGADDYLTKPFALAELMARLRALARRGRPERPAVLEVGDLRLDPARREVRRGEQEIDLSAKEFALLEAMMRRPGEVFSRLELIESVWDIAYENRSNVIDVYVRRLRNKLDDPSAATTIETVRGVGYRIKERPRRGCRSASGWRRRSPSPWRSCWWARACSFMDGWAATSPSRSTRSCACGDMISRSSRATLTDGSRPSRRRA